MGAASPIIIMSFNRPGFLEPTLASIVAQRDGALAGREVHLFQDGAVNRYTRIRYAEDADIDASVETFRRFFPDGVVHRSADNIGIFENFRRAEAYCFSERVFDCAYFFEDDLVLSPVYLDVLDELDGWAARTGNVAYFAAYGNYYATADEVRAHERELRGLDHQWAFGIRREAWAKIQPLLGDYEWIVGGTDYSRRDHRRVFELYQQYDRAPRASSQDAAKAFACNQAGLWRANTYVPYARYIGSVGQHMTPEQFKEMGFERTAMRNERTPMDLPNAEQVAAFVEEESALFRQIREHELAGLMEGLPPRYYNPLRPCTREDVDYGYRLFLNRPPESEAIVARLAGRQSVLDFVAGLTGSDEYQRLHPNDPAPPATREDVDYAYRLTLQRDPDGENIYAGHVGITNPHTLTVATWNGNARRALWASIDTLTAREVMAR